MKNNISYKKWIVEDVWMYGLIAEATEKIKKCVVCDASVASI
jgi:hypothetical protein